MSDSYYACEESFADARLWTCVGPFNSEQAAKTFVNAALSSKTVIIQTNVRLPVVMFTKAPATSIVATVKSIETEWLSH
jgi:hypothetical protein